MMRTLCDTKKKGVLMETISLNNLFNYFRAINIIQNDWQNNNVFTKEGGVGNHFGNKQFSVDEV